MYERERKRTWVRSRPIENDGLGSSGNDTSPDGSADMFQLNMCLIITAFLNRSSALCRRAAALEHLEIKQTAWSNLLTARLLLLCFASGRFIKATVAFVFPPKMKITPEFSYFHFIWRTDLHATTQPRHDKQERAHIHKLFSPFSSELITSINPAFISLGARCSIS